jgi:hypothetical protein
MAEFTDLEAEIDWFDASALWWIQPCLTGKRNPYFDDSEWFLLDGTISNELARYDEHDVFLPGPQERISYFSMLAMFSVTFFANSAA